MRNKPILLIAVLTVVGISACAQTLCVRTCSPDPNSPTYSANASSQFQPQNQRGTVTVAVPGTNIGPATLLFGSQSYTYAVPILHIAGRAGLDLDLTLFYNSAVWTFNPANNSVTFNADHDWPSYGFRLDFGLMEYVGGRYILVEANGAKHAFVDNNDGTFDTADSTYINFSLNAGVACSSCPGGGSWPVTYKNGRQVWYEFFPSSAAPQQTTSFFRPRKINDTNGNFITITYVSGTDQQINTITDTLGRVIQFNYDANGHLSSITSNSGARTWATFTWATNYIFAYNFSATVDDSPANGATLSVLTQVTLPNGTSYGFSYALWGIVAQVTNASSSGQWRAYQAYNWPGTGIPLSMPPTYTQQTVFDGSSTRTWHYSAVISNNFVGQVNITDPSGAITSTNLFTASGDWRDGLVSSIQTTDSGNHDLRTMQPTWTADDITNANPRLSSMLTTLNDTGQQSRIDFLQYDNYGNILDQKEYDFGINLLREINHSYLATATYTSSHILDRPIQTIVKDASGNTISRTDFAYDSTNFTSTITGAANHDDTYAAPRANLTSVTRYADAVTPGGTILQTFSYDSLGNLVIAQMDCCNQKQWKFSSATQYAYPDSVVTGPSGGPQLTTSATYNLDTGTVATRTDENLQVTRYQYDTMNRISTSTLPNSVVTSYTYDDSSVSPSLSMSNSANSAVNKTVLDGLGRTLQQQLLNGSTLISRTDTQYDDVNRRIETSNPYVTGETQLWTVQQFDALGRLIQVTPPSGGSYEYQYSGNTMTTTDPTLRQRRQISDALGRLIEVDEPQASSLGGTPSTASVPVSGSIGSVITSSVISPGASTPIVQAGPGDFYYLDTNGHIREITLLSSGTWAGWSNYDVTSATGAQPAISGSHVIAYRDGSGRTYVLYVGSNQHLEVVYYTSGWNFQDLTNTLPWNVVPTASTPFVMPSGGDFYYEATDGNIYQITLLSNGTWAGWSNYAVTANSGGPTVATGSQMFGYRDGAGRTYVLYVGSNGHLETVYYDNAWKSLDLTNTLPWNVTPATATPFTMAGAGNFYYIATDQNIYSITLQSDGTWSPYSNYATTANTGAPTPGTASNLFGYFDSAGRTYVLYVGSNGHLETVYYNGGWRYQDLTNTLPWNIVPAASTPFTMASAGNFYYIDSNGNIFSIMLQSDGTWSSSSNWNTTGNTGGTTAAVGSSLKAYYDSSARTYVLYAGSNFHLDDVYYNSNWYAQDLSVAFASTYDSGTVSLPIGNFTATACFGNNTNPVCSGQSLNTTASQVATALANAINGSSSVPATASVSGSTISLTWKTPGPFTPSVGPLVTSHDNPNLFGSASFTSPATNFSGGTGNLGSNPSVTQYIYDARGNLTKIVEGAQTRSQNYDGLGRLKSTTLPESGNTTYSYLTSAGASCSTNPFAVCFATDARGVTTTYTYDGLNRLTSQVYNVGSTGVPATATVSYTYGTSASSNNNGRLVQMTDGAGSESYTYDVVGRLTQLSRVIKNTAYKITYGYNGANQLTSITYPSGRIVSPGYDATGRLTQIASGGTTYLSGLSYNSAQLPTRFNYGNGIAASRGFNDRLQLSSLSYALGTNTLLSLTYNYNDANGNNNGQIQGITDSRGAAYSTSYSYDGLGRLSQAQTNDLTAGNTWQLSFGLDRYGNRVSQTLTGGTASVYQPQLIADATTNRLSSLSYDAAGNVTQDAANTYVYNGENELTQVTNANATYAYDGHRWRITKTVGRTTTNYIYSGSSVIAEYTGTNLSKEYLYWNGQLLATIAGSTVTYHHPDHLSNRFETNSSGTVTRTFGHLPYGDVWYETGTADKWKFTSYERDSESGEDYALNRFYGSRYGRFHSPDLLPGSPGNPQSLNRYAYVMDDPSNMTDPSGMEALGFVQNDQGACGDPLFYRFNPWSCPDLEVFLGGFSGVLGEGLFPGENAGIPSWLPPFLGPIESWMADLPWNNPCTNNPWIFDGCGLSSFATGPSDEYCYTPLPPGQAGPPSPGCGHASAIFGGWVPRGCLMPNNPYGCNSQELAIARNAYSDCVSALADSQRFKDTVGKRIQDANRNGVIAGFFSYLLTGWANNEEVEPSPQPGEIPKRTRNSITGYLVGMDLSLLNTYLDVRNLQEQQLNACGWSW